MQQILQRYYSKMGKDFVNAFSEIIPAIMSCGNSSGGLIANQMSKINNKSFKTNDMRLHRFLKSSNFQIDEKFWRMHINLLFDILQENNLINQNVPITRDPALGQHGQRSARFGGEPLDGITIEGDNARHVMDFGKLRRSGPSGGAATILASP